MKGRLREAARRVAANPVLRKSAESIKPAPNVWGLLGTFFFFIAPEIVGFVKGREIASWAHAMMLEEPDRIGRSVYRMLQILFEDGGSWINLTIGMALLAWILYEWRRNL
jgi:hypothetical protein